MALTLACAAIAGPALLPIGTPPLISLGTEALALLVWGLWLAWLLPRLSVPGTAAGRPRDPGLSAIAVAGCLLLASVAASVLFSGLPAAIGLRHGAVLLSAALALYAGVRLAQASATALGLQLAESAMLCFAFAGLASAAIAVLQYFGVAGWWDPLREDGRTGGNLGQPNLLATQLLWAFAAWVALRARGRLSRKAAAGGAALLIVALAMTGSRAGALSCLVLAAWGAVDRRLARDTRLLLLGSPVALALAWAGLDALQFLGGPGFSGSGRLQNDAAISSRLVVWQQSGVLIAANPWHGVGWGQFNFAWTLTPLPGLPRTMGVTFTHAHNLLVHWAVEMGLPTTIALAGLLGYALLRGMASLRHADGDAAVLQRAALAMVLIVLVHSQLEFPLWEAHFLLPATFLLGLAIATPRGNSALSGTTKNAAVAPLLMALAGAFALLDYRAIADVWSPPPESPPMAQRIDTARQSWLFSHFADRFDGTLASSGQRSLEPYKTVVFELIDLRLLASWSLAYAETGELEKARFLAARLREFDTPTAQRFFAVCAAEPARFQCSPNTAPFGFRDFR